MLARTALAWNDTGHKTVALIAWEDLKPEARARITALLLKHPKYATLIQTKGATDDESHLLDFMTAATWPDLIRPNKPENREYQHSPWHYTDFPYITGKLPAGTADPKMPPTDWKPGEVPDNVLTALSKCVADIKDPKATDEQKAVALAWIEHLIGDVHQPLHAVSWFSEEYPAGDKGGNNVIVNAAGSITNLHSYWDGLLGKYESLAITQDVATKIKADHPRSGFTKELKDTTFKDWAQESYDACNVGVYMEGKIPHITADAQKADKMTPVPPLSQEYMDAAKALARQRIALAGYRLADELNGLFGDE
jgi:hypothetical protein